MSTRSTIALVGPFHLYYELIDDWYHLAVGFQSYPRFAPKVWPARKYRS